jgi:hypothetical protein
MQFVQLAQPESDEVLRLDAVFSSMQLCGVSGLANCVLADQNRPWLA